MFDFLEGVPVIDPLFNDVIAPAAEWWHEEFDKPFGAAITAPLHEGWTSAWKPIAAIGIGAASAAAAPLTGGASLAVGASVTGLIGAGLGKMGDTETSYDQWDAPSWDAGPIDLGVKGAAEFNPIGFAGGGTLAQIGGKFAKAGIAGGRAIEKAGRALETVEMALPRALSSTVKSTGRVLNISRPINPAAVINDIKLRAPDRLKSPEGLEEITEAWNINLAGQELGANQVAPFMAQLDNLANDNFNTLDFKRIFKINEKGYVQHPSIVPKKPGKITTEDVFGSPDSFNWIGEEGALLRQYVDTGIEMQGMLTRVAEENGITYKHILMDIGDMSDDAIEKMTEEQAKKYVGRMVVGKHIVVDGKDKIIDVTPGSAKSLGSKTTAEKSRLYDNMADAIEDGVIYAPFNEMMAARYTQVYNRIAQKQAQDRLLGLTQTIKLANGKTVERPLIRKPLERINVDARKTSIQLGKDYKKAVRGDKALRAAISQPEKRIGKDLLEQLPEDVQKQISDIQGGLFRSPEEAQRLLDASGMRIDQARANVNAFKAQYKKAREIASHPKFGEEGRIDLPAYRAHIVESVVDENGNIIKTGKEVADLINNKFTPQDVGVALRTASKVARTGVAATAGMDLSWPLIQGLPVLGNDMGNWLMGRKSTAFYDAFKGMFKSLKDPKYIEQKLARENEFLTRHPDLITEMSEYYVGTDILEAAWSKVPVAGNTVAKAYKKTGKAFSHAGLEARINIAKGEELRHAARLGVTVDELPASTLREIDEMANKLSGVVSTRTLGVSAKQSAIESATLFAPRFLRANLMLIRDAFTRGGISGAMAKKALGFQLAGMIGSYYAICEALGQEPKINPAPADLGGDGGKFMTFKIGGNYVGAPGFMYGMLRLAGGVAAAASQDPSKLVALDIRENPSLKWMTSKGSPIMNFGREIKEGRDFMGNRIDSMEDWATIAAQKVTPIMFQNFVSLDQDGNSSQLFGEMWGTRTWSVSDWDKRDDMRNQELAGSGRKWEELTNAERDSIERNNPELKALTEKIKVEYNELKGTDFERAYAMTTTSVNNKFNESLTALSDMLTQGYIGFREYNDNREKLLAERGAAKSAVYGMKEILDSKSIQEIDKWVEENQLPEDKAMGEYKELMRSPERDATGQIDWGKTYKKADSYLQAQPVKIRNYIITNANNWILDLPETAKQIELRRKEMKEALIPYWRLTDETYEEFSAKPGFGNLSSLRITWDQYESKLIADLYEQGIPVQAWTEIINGRKQQIAPALIGIDAEVRNRKEIYLGTHPETAQMLRIWNS